ncbi:uncharacterized protein MELLADRAFT_110984 [Melampsora larici-populina 98AG31]|uniref:Uncharacterized protein n=1 Tax=Melampsora larici-populina (strain 98AG31 / pathotype 3-4-7) TaxID=747676 RepID=F4S1N1_MELLP|nr:uncharacterized protein MELLADRAFT_110984 [Melampsora larici-populina 98AG31]EGG01406.1 hypothetical protein MELLADRAFT_110984 [Melampsora larici-populina 98AG31]
MRVTLSSTLSSIIWENTLSISREGRMFVRVEQMVEAEQPALRTSASRDAWIRVKETVQDVLKDLKIGTALLNLTKLLWLNSRIEKFRFDSQANALHCEELSMARKSSYFTIRPLPPEEDFYKTDSKSEVSGRYMALVHGCEHEEGQCFGAEEAIPLSSPNRVE